MPYIALIHELSVYGLLPRSPDWKVAETDNSAIHVKNIVLIYAWNIKLSVRWCRSTHGNNYNLPVEDSL